MVFDTSQQKDGAVSPVIGVVLMVAITVILAAIIGTFVLGLGQETNAGANAGASFDQVNDSAVRVTITSAPRADSITLSSSSSDGSFATSSWDLSDTGTSQLVGKTTLYEDNTNNDVAGDTLTVQATYQGETQVVQQYTVGG
jgi:flagellin-like protein